MDTINNENNDIVEVAHNNLVSHKDIQLAFLDEGLEGVRQRFAEGLVSAKVINRAAQELSNRNGVSENDLNALNAFVNEITPAPAVPGRRGKQPPTIGETRTYKAQQVKNGGPFLRLNLETLGINKGEPVAVSFENGRIVVTRHAV